MRKFNKLLYTAIISISLLVSSNLYASTYSDPNCKDEKNLYVPEVEQPTVNKPSLPDWFDQICIPKPEKPSEPSIGIDPVLPEVSLHIPYIKGYEDGTFRPERSITREEIATMIARLLLDGIEPKDNSSFKDISDNRYSNKYIGYLEKLEIVLGDEEGNFRPYEPITRAEMADIIQKVEPIAGKTSTVIKERGFANPDIYLTRAEAVTTLNEIFNRECSDAVIPNMYNDLESSYWAYQDILFASVEHIHQVN